jgi:hypothetical protein
MAVIGRHRARLIRAALVILPGLLYLTIGLAFSLGAGIVTGDAWSRVGNAYYVLFSRDPHLAAIGFVWNPLPSLLELPLLPLAVLWRPLVDHNVAASLMSAACMALAVRELWLWLRELGTGRPIRIGLTLAFVAHPLVLLYGGNGMSEAPFLLFLIIAGRAFSGWLADRSLGRLVVTGLALALAYLTRYEAVAPIGAVILVTLAASYRRAPGTSRERAVTALADGLIVGMPPVAAFLAWAFASWIIVGSPFATFTSIYGNTSQVQISLDAIRASTGDTPAAAAAYLGQQILGLEPLLPIIAIVGVAAALLRRDGRVLAPLAVFSSVLAFSSLFFLVGGSFGWLRFSIAAIPLAVVVAAIVVSPSTRASGTPAEDPRSRPRRIVQLVGAGSGALVVVLALIGLPQGVQTVFDGRLAREEAPVLAGLIAGDRQMPGERREFIVSGEVARYLDSQNLPRGSVVVDVALGFWVVLQSEHPEQFVITPDRDFERVAGDPAVFKVPYILVSPPSGVAAVNAIERAHPGMFARGGGIATLVAEFDNPDGSGTAWRLYRVDD